MRLRAIREYTAHRACTCTGEIQLHVLYEVTFADEDGIVVAHCTFDREDLADYVINAVNASYDRDGTPCNHCSTWYDPFIDDKGFCHHGKDVKEDI